MRHVRAFKKAKQPVITGTDGTSDNCDSPINNDQPNNGAGEFFHFHRSFLALATEEENMELTALVSEWDVYLSFICSSDESTFAPNQVAFKNVTKSLLNKSGIEMNSDGDQVVEMHGYVVGTVISQCEKFLYANVRAWPENAVANPDTAPPISNQVEVRVIELD